MKDRKIYVPRERKNVLLRVSSLLCCIATVLLWVIAERIGLNKGDLLIMTGIAVLLLTLSASGKRAERKAAEQSEAIRKLREETGNGDYNSDVFFKE